MRARVIIVGEYDVSPESYPEGADPVAYDKKSFEEGAFGVDELVDMLHADTVTVSFEKMDCSAVAPGTATIDA